MSDEDLMPDRWVSSIDIINKTGISRATLNNYIRMNMLPKPKVGKPLDAKTRARMIGYFPQSVLDIIEQIKRSKKEGKTMASIRAEMKKADSDVSGDLMTISSASPSASAHVDRREHLPLFMESAIPGMMDFFSCRSKILNDLLAQRMPTLLTFCVIVADLQDAVRICAELPPEEYFELVHQIWACAEGFFKQYYGVYGRHGKEGILYYFPSKRDHQYMIDAISCALEMRESIKKLSMEWKIRKGWDNDLYLNIGINEGQEYFGTIPSAPGIAFTTLGDSVHDAEHLSEFARHGAIWTTKNLMNKLTTEERARIHYGIRRSGPESETQIENSFRRIMDMPGQDNGKTNKFMGIATLAVTEILGKR